MQQQALSIIIPILLIPLLSLALWRLRLKKLKTYYSSQLGKIEVFQKYNQEKLLTINTYAQGVSVNDKSIEKSYWYSIAEQTVKHCGNKKNPQILILGLGANTISNLIAKLNPQIHQTIIEFDELIIQACTDFFGLNELPNKTLIHADAYKLFDEKPCPLVLNSFDAIIVDIFTGKPPYVSLKSNQPNFIEKLLPFIKEDGMIIFNRPGNTREATDDSKKLQDYLSTLFKQTKIFDINDPRGYLNNVITAAYPCHNLKFKKSIIVLAGPPLTGKSTLGKKLAKISNFTLLDVDEIRQGLFTSDKRLSEKEERNIMRVCYQKNHQLAKELLLKNQPVILVATYSRDYTQEMLKKVAQDTKSPLNFFLLNTPEEEIKIRLKKRQEGKSLSNIKTYQDFLAVKNRFQEITDIDIQRIDTSKPQSQSLQQILESLDDLKI